MHCDAVVYDKHRAEFRFLDAPRRQREGTALYTIHFAPIAIDSYSPNKVSPKSNSNSNTSEANAAGRMKSKG